MTSASRPAPVQRTTVLIIGAGVSGIAMAVNLRKRGIDDFVVLEMSEGAGGTWWDNRYPGVEVDVPSSFYSFSFAPHVFSRTHADAGAMLAYLNEVVRAHDLAGCFRFGEKVERVEWDSASAEYEVETVAGSRWRSRYVVSCVGQLNNPGYPAWAVDSPFQGELVHTARWNDAIALNGKSVAVVGTGSTSAQVVPEVAKTAASVYVFQRQPGWVLPKEDRTYSQAERARLERSRVRQRLARLRTYVDMERLTASARKGTKANRRMQQAAEEYLAKTIEDPVLRTALLPDYPFFGKRVVLSQDFYPALNRPNVTLIPKAVDHLTQKGVVDVSGQETVVDVVILATGFQPSNFLATFDVIGKGGARLKEQWGAEPRSFLGMMTPGFPNFFVTYGPNTNGGSIIFFVERQAEWISKALGVAERHRRSIEVRPRVVELCDKLVAWGNSRFVWSHTQNNYYTSTTGRVVTQWPFSQTTYWVLTRLIRPRLACRVR
ncbi:flavin-containing monooxygenase [Phytohabitans kaempferiae]|uniref:Flavin-containing monooxygenase n=1 Tax=Phytohabitans kaempferiae TaxID=1620943 RepID=A0ABV6LYP4_9ACTN